MQSTFRKLTSKASPAQYKDYSGNSKKFLFLFFSTGTVVISFTGNNLGFGLHPCVAVNTQRWIPQEAKYIECWPCPPFDSFLNKYFLLASLLTSRDTKCTDGTE
jgi:hypothetical protein